AEYRVRRVKTWLQAELRIRISSPVFVSALIAQHSALVLPRGDVSGQFTERVGSRTERGGAGNRGGHPVVCQLSGAFGSVERRVRFLSSPRVGVGILAQFF